MSAEPVTSPAAEVAAARRVIALSGGVGGAKLAAGLAAELGPAELLIVGNTGDDFEHLGLPVCPDLDTLMYTLAGLADPQQGWGLAGESWQCLGALSRYGAPDWFRLGDRELATHLARGHWLREGHSLTEVTARLSAALGVRHAIVPMSDTPVRTRVATAHGELAFQEYFVRERCAPQVSALRYEGAEHAAPSAPLAQWLAAERAPAVVICPSNPFLSIDPILALPRLRTRLIRARTVAVSPIVGGKALKGPAAALLQQLGLEVSALAVARHYRALLRGFVLDHADADEAGAVRALGLEVLVTDTVMTDLDSKRRLAHEVLGFIDRLPA
jgi:LPPG:FO 2-phospho-L-lactate transferase